jgi:hypothetical protein
VDIARLSFLPPAAIGHAAMTVLNQLQDFPPEEQIAAVGMCFAALLRKHSALSGDVLPVVTNMVADRKNSCREMQALNLYINGEL